MIFGWSEILTLQQLKRLGDHKYSSQGSTFLDPWMQKYWTWIVTKFPLWWAPNLMTLTGLAVNIVTSLILVYYSPDAKQDVSLPIVSQTYCNIHVCRFTMNRFVLITNDILSRSHLGRLYFVH